MTAGLKLMHADVHTAYLPRVGVDRIHTAYDLAEQITAHKQEHPESHIHDRLVDQLVTHLQAGVKSSGLMPEDPTWTPPQRIVWRAAHSDHMPLSSEEKLKIIADRKIHKGVSAFVRVNGGHWIVDCPMPGCSSAQYASLEDPRFFCCDCAMRAIGGKWVAVVWPTNPPDIEAELERRPLEVRHWHPGETRADLAHQDKIALGKAPIQDPNTWPKTTTLIVDGKEVEVPVIHYGTPEWDASQKAPKSRKTKV